MKKVETRLEEETRRVQQYLSPTTETELIQKCDRVLIEKHLDTIRADFQNMLSNDKIEGTYIRRSMTSTFFDRPNLGR